jgi:hypothetical protein
MAGPCDDVELFVDGELAPAYADAFRNHLPDCGKCQRRVKDLLHLKLQVHHHASGTAALPAPIPLFRRQRVIQAVGSLAAAVLVLVGVRLLLPGPSGTGHVNPHVAELADRYDVWLTRRPERQLEARLGYAGADVHRPLAARMMGGAGGAPQSQPFEAYAILQREDPHGLAAAHLVFGVREKADDALGELEKLGHSPERVNDRAVALMLKGQHADALRLLDAVLAEHPRHPQALWNRGLVLRELGLPLLAARAFSEVASLREPGWSEEAAQKAEALQRATEAQRNRWKVAVQSGRALLDAPVAVLPPDFDGLPIARLFFYDAVRSAPHRERVRELLPLARKLDARASNSVLEDYVHRVAAADFSRRGPLARTYAAHGRERPAQAEQERFLKALQTSREDDILLGALLKSEAISRDLGLYEAKAAATGDAWFQLLAAQERAKVELAAGDWKRAIQTLTTALERCPAPGLEYRCLYLERELSHLYIRHRRVDAARLHAERGWRQARALGEWQLEHDLLWTLSQVARVVNDTTLARAYLGEYLERGRGDPDDQRRAHQDLASMALNELRVDEARREIDAALATGLPLSFSGAFTLVEISRLKPGTDDEKHLVRALESARPGLAAGELAVANHILGRFYLEHGDSRGNGLLQKSIEDAEGLGPEVDGAKRARAYSYTSLIHDAGKRGRFGEALSLFARERGSRLSREAEPLAAMRISPRQERRPTMVLPGACLLAVSTDFERTLLVALSASGELLGHFDESRRQPLSQRLDGLVPEHLLKALRDCPRVEVLARPPIHGMAGLLPPELAWSYLTRTGPAEPPRTGAGVHLVVSEVELPPGSTLRRLNAWTPSFAPDARRITLSGAEATPSRVLDAMKDATEIDLVTHGIIDGSSQASYLLLAPGQGDPELSVAEVRAASLRGAPFVVLAACHAAHTAYSVDSPFSLPAAFIEAGARGVLAATVEIPDLEAGAFFNAVRGRIRAGTPPAVALRDERMKWLAEKRGARWLDSVLLFE